IEALVGIAIDTNAVLADLALLDGAKLTSKQLKDCLRDLQELPPMPDIAGKMDLGQRFIALDMVMMINREGIHAFEGLSGDTPPKARDPKTEHLLDDVDWDPALRNTNRWHDRVVSVLRRKDRAARDKQVGAIEDELKGMKEELGSTAVLVRDEKVSPKV